MRTRYAIICALFIVWTTTTQAGPFPSNDTIARLAHEQDIQLRDIGYPASNSSIEDVSDVFFYSTGGLYENCQRAIGGKSYFSSYQKNFNYVNKNMEVAWQTQWQRAHDVAFAIQIYLSSQVRRQVERYASGGIPREVKAAIDQKVLPDGQNVVAKGRTQAPQRFGAMIARKMWEFYYPAMIRLGVKMWHEQRQCGAITILSSQSESNEYVTVRKPKATFDGKIKCASYGRITQDYDACLGFLNAYEVQLAAALGLKSANELRVQLKNQEFTDDFTEGQAGNQSKVLKNQESVQRIATEAAGSEAALSVASAAIFAGYAEEFPDESMMINYCRQIYPANHQLGASQFYAYMRYVQALRNNIISESNLDQDNINLAVSQRRTPQSGSCDSGKTIADQEKELNEKLTEVMGTVELILSVMTKTLTVQEGTDQATLQAKAELDQMLSTYKPHSSNTDPGLSAFVSNLDTIDFANLKACYDADSSKTYAAEKRAYLAEINRLKNMAGVVGNYRDFTNNVRTIEYKTGSEGFVQAKRNNCKLNGSFARNPSFRPSNDRTNFRPATYPEGWWIPSSEIIFNPGSAAIRNSAGAITQAAVAPSTTASAGECICIQRNGEINTIDLSQVKPPKCDNSRVPLPAGGNSLNNNPYYRPL